MAVFVVINPENNCGMGFQTGTTNLASKIKNAADYSEVITLQLDGDELYAALWGLEHYREFEARRRLF